MLKRKVEKDIMRWIDSSDKALLVYGVRQAGKTFVIRECLKVAGADYIEFNLIDTPGLIEIINTSVSAGDLVMKLSLASGREVTPGKTIFFFDEIQKCREIVTKIKFLVEDRRFRYILSGSLLGVELVNIKSAPVGYLETIMMFPLDFEEFLQVFNVSDEIFDILRHSFDSRTPLDSMIHKRMMDIFNLYLIIGGMPAAVEKYRSTSDIDAVIREHNSIIEQYKVDFTKYEQENRKLMVTQVYNLIPSELNEKNKRFMFSDIKKNLRYERVEDSFVWLWKAGVALGVFNVTEPVLPLMLNEKNTLFKVFISDVGLLTTMYGKSTKLEIVTKNKDLNMGAVYENVVAEELNSHGYQLYYYNSKKKGELDFVVEHRGSVLPIEVKSGKDYEKHSALDNVMAVDEYGIKEAYVFTNDNVKTDGKITYLPIYMVMFLNADDITFIDISPEKFRF